MKDKKISTRVYEKYDVASKKFILGNKLNFYLSDLGGVMEAGREADCCVNLAGQLFIIAYPYNEMLSDYEAYKQSKIDEK